MKQSLKRWTALLLALVMTASLLPAVSLPSAAQKETVGTLDHTDIISLPVTIRNFSADGMLFEWDGIGGGVYEEKPFRNPYNTSDITDPVPFVGANPAVGQLFCNDWDVSRENLNKVRTGNEEGLTYHYGETYDSRYAHIDPNENVWHEYNVWSSNVANKEDTQYMVIRFRALDGFASGADNLFVKRYYGSTFAQAKIDLSRTSADVEDNGAYKLIGTEDGWTTMAVDLNASGVQGSDHTPLPNEAVSRISIGFNENTDDNPYTHVLDVSYIAFFKFLKHTEVGDGCSFRYCAYDFINQDYCYRMDDPTITMVEPRPAIGMNALLAYTIETLSCTGAGASITNHGSDHTEPKYDWDKYVTIQAGSEQSATATVWSYDGEPYPAGMARYLAIRCMASDDTTITILADNKSIYSFNPHTTTSGSAVKEILEDSTTENGALVNWKTFIIDTGFTNAISSMGVEIPAGSAVHLAYVGLFEKYTLNLTTGYNYATDAHVFVFEDYSYRHDRESYNTSIERYKIYTDPNLGDAIRIMRGNGSAFDPVLVYNNENNFYLKGATAVTPVTTFSATNGTKNGIVEQNTEGYRYLKLQDTGSDEGIGLRTILMNDVNKPTNQLRYVVVSYCVSQKGKAVGDTVPMYVLMDTKSSGISGHADVILGFFDAVADGGWHVDVLDLSNCVTRSPNGETFRYKPYSSVVNNNVTYPTVQRIGLADGWAVQGLEFDLAYMAFFSEKRDAEQYGNAYSEAFKSIRTPPEGANNAKEFSVITDAFTAKLGQVKDSNDSGEANNGNKKFRVGSNNGFELLDPDYAYNNNNYYDTLPNYYKDMGFGEWIRNDGHYTQEVQAQYTNYNVGENNNISYYNDDHWRDLDTNGASDIWAKSDDTYGYIMGLTDRKLDDDGLPRYRKEVVEYLAQLLQKALCVPRTFVWDNTHYFSANFVQGDVDPTRFGYYDEAEPDQPENINAMFPRDYAGWLRFKLGVTYRDGSLTGETGAPGTWNETQGKAVDLLSDDPVLGMNSITTWTDAAYYMLNTLFRETGGSHTVPEYKYLQLVREQPKAGGASYYVFDTSYTNVMFDFDKGIIGNNSPNVDPDKSDKDTTNGLVATYAFLPILRELPEFQGTFPYLKDTGIAAKDDGADSYYNRDYNFSLECHGKFTYYRDKDLFFEFNGDDDVYLYVDGTCVLDLGGGHRPANQHIKLNDYVDQHILNLQDGEVYSFDFFYLERHGTGSNLRIQTNMEVYGDKIETTKQAFQNESELPDHSSADFTKPVEYSFSIKNVNVADQTEIIQNFSFNDDDIGFYAGFDKLELGKFAKDGADRQASDLTVTVTDENGNALYDSPIQVENDDHLKRLLTDLDGRGGLAYGQTLTLSGVSYTISESLAAFSNTVISRAGKHSGVAYHHLVNTNSSGKFFAWKDHELVIPLSKILRGRDPMDMSDWNDVYLCDEALNRVSGDEALAALHITRWNIDRENKLVKVIFDETGTTQLSFTSDSIDEEIGKYAIKVDCHVFDVQNDVYVLDFDGLVRLGKESDNGFAANDKLTVPGVKTRVLYEAFTDVAPEYDDVNGRLSFPHGENEAELWPKEPEPEPEKYSLTVTLGNNMSADNNSNLSQTELTEGTAITQVTVTPNGLNQFQYIIPEPEIQGSRVAASLVPEEDVLYINMTKGEPWWIDPDATNEVQHIYFFKDANDSKWGRAYPVEMAQEGKIYAVHVPKDNDGKYYQNIIILRSGSATPSWSDFWNRTSDISIAGFGPNRNYLSRFTKAQKDNNTNTWTGTEYTFETLPYNGAVAGKIGKYIISGRLYSDVTVHFADAVALPLTPDSGSTVQQPTRSLPVRENEGIEYPTAPYYFRDGNIASPEGDDDVKFTNEQGSFLVKLFSDADQLPTLNFKPSIMDGTAVIWLTSRVYEGTNPGENLGNVDVSKEVEMYQSITVLPANVVYYEDDNIGIHYHSQPEEGQPTVIWTHVGDGTAPTQSAEQDGVYGFDNGYVDGNGNHYSGNGETKITFKGNAVLADFDFTGTGFDLFSRCEKNGPTIIAKVYTFSSTANHDYIADTPLQTIYLTTEFSNYGHNDPNNPDAMYQVPVLSVQGLSDTPAKYHVVLEGIGRLDMTDWSIIKVGDDYHLVKKSDTTEHWKIIFATADTPTKYQRVVENGNGNWEPSGAPVELSPAAMEIDFWLDGLRIYNALGSDAQSQYYNEKEANASFTEIRDLLVKGKATAVSFTQSDGSAPNLALTDFTTTVELSHKPSTGFTLENNGEADLSYYFLVGPNNELYLNGNGDQLQAAVFSLKREGAEGVRTLQIAAKQLDSASFSSVTGAAELQYWTAATGDEPAGWKTITALQSGTELYYELDPTLCPTEDKTLDGGGTETTYTVIIAAGPGSMVSLTKLKYKGWSFAEYYSTETNFIRDNSGHIIGISSDGAKHLTHVVRQLSAAYLNRFVPELPFADVSSAVWYADAVRWAYSSGITAGTSENAFSPDAVCTRAQIVTFLWKAAGAPEPTQSASFSDVPANAWYSKAVSWACENGVTAGTSANTFSPKAVCTRSQAVTFLWRYAGSLQSGGSSGFEDVAADAWYADAVAWAVEHGITAGTSSSTFSPAQICTRAEIVTFLYKQAESINGGEQQ